jgi:hypothetical protein
MADVRISGMCQHSAAQVKSGARTLLGVSMLCTVWPSGLVTRWVQTA